MLSCVAHILIYCVPAGELFFNVSIDQFVYKISENIEKKPITSSHSPWELLVLSNQSLKEAQFTVNHFLI